MNHMIQWIIWIRCAKSGHWNLPHPYHYAHIYIRVIIWVIVIILFRFPWCVHKSYKISVMDKEQQQLTQDQFDGPMILHLSDVLIFGNNFGNRYILSRQENTLSQSIHYIPAWSALCVWIRPIKISLCLYILGSFWLSSSFRLAVSTHGENSRLISYKCYLTHTPITPEGFLGGQQIVTVS